MGQDDPWDLQVCPKCQYLLILYRYWCLCFFHTYEDTCQWLAHLGRQVLTLLFYKRADAKKVFDLCKIKGEKLKIVVQERICLVLFLKMEHLQTNLDMCYEHQYKKTSLCPGGEVRRHFSQCGQQWGRSICTPRRGVRTSLWKGPPLPNHPLQGAQARLLGTLQKGNRHTSRPLDFRSGCANRTHPVVQQRHRRRRRLEILSRWAVRSCLVSPESRISATRGGKRT